MAKIRIMDTYKRRKTSVAKAYDPPFFRWRCYETQGREAIELQFSAPLLEQLRWGKNPRIDPVYDPDTGELTVARTEEHGLLVSRRKDHIRGNATFTRHPYHQLPVTDAVRNGGVTCPYLIKWVDDQAVLVVRLDDKYHDEDQLELDVEPPKGPQPGPNTNVTPAPKNWVETITSGFRRLILPETQRESHS